MRYNFVFLMIDDEDSGFACNLLEARVPSAETEIGRIGGRVCSSIRMKTMKMKI